MAVEKDSRWERRTWPKLEHLAKEVPEAGIHFQSESSPHCLSSNPILTFNV